MNFKEKSTAFFNRYVFAENSGYLGVFARFFLWGGFGRWLFMHLATRPNPLLSVLLMLLPFYGIMGALTRGFALIGEFDKMKNPPRHEIILRRVFLALVVLGILFVLLAGQGTGGRAGGYYRDF